jgi:hypothetical protein
MHASLPVWYLGDIPFVNELFSGNRGNSVLCNRAKLFHLRLHRHHLRLCEFGLEREDLAHFLGTSFCARSKAALTLFSANDMALAIASFLGAGRESLRRVCSLLCGADEAQECLPGLLNVFFSEVDDPRRNPLWKVDHVCSPAAILRSVLDASGSGGHGCSYRRNLESLLAFVCTYKQPRAKRRIPNSIRVTYKAT